MSEGNQYADRRITNWSEYNQALINRGSVTFWLDDDAIENWYSNTKSKAGRGLAPTFSDTALQTCLMIGAVYGLARRQTQGFVNSLFKLMKVPHHAPHYTIYSKSRGKNLTVTIPRRLPVGAVDIVVDSTGVKVHGEGEWKVRKHGVGKRRVWRKLHLGIDPKTNEVLAAELTTIQVGDSEVLPDLLKQLPEDQQLGTVIGDGAYDTKGNYSAVIERGGKHIAPPQKGAVDWEENHPRNEAVAKCATDEGRAKWKKEVGYHQRSLSETAMYRYKTIIGRMLRARLFETQNVEALVGVTVINRMNTLGMPKRA